ncbi:hypothetical protein [Hymenobacter aerophilus]|uniref:hypothetical protein n=1 Tax=Hymenobacter aerophilus TaxID=119644 RepID=UPI00146DA17E|nr:hypothetical protein [Hymenobacter aerophilus]
MYTVLRRLRASGRRLKMRVWLACAARDIEANITRNRRATDWQAADYTFFDPELYRRRAVVEYANAWLDSFKTLHVCYEISIGNWLAWHWLAFVVLLLREISPKSTF